LKSKGVYIVVAHIYTLLFLFGVTITLAMGIVEATVNEGVLDYREMKTIEETLFPVLDEAKKRTLITVGLCRADSPVPC